jgi:NhaP-type Na+/H+ or K+/H+ antiporter
MGWAMVPLTILNLCIARALNVGIVSYLVNKSRTTKKINRKFQFVMWVSGLRGAMAYALALKSTFDFEKGPIMLIVTLIYAVISIVGVGSFMNTILEKFDVSDKSVKTTSATTAIIKSLNQQVQGSSTD